MKRLISFFQASHTDYMTKTTEFTVQSGVVTRLDIILEQEAFTTESTLSAASTTQQLTTYWILSSVPLIVFSLNYVILG